MEPLDSPLWVNGGGGVCTRVARRREVVAALPVGTTTAAGLGMKTWRTGPTCENNSQRISSVTSGWKPLTLT